MFKNKLNKALLSLILVCCMTLAACSASTVINDIDIASNAAATAAPIVLGLTTLPAATQTLILNYVTAANSGIGCAATAASASTNTAVVSAAILKCLAGLNISPTLPAGVPQEVATIITALAGDIATIINLYAPVPATQPAAAPPVKLTHGDHQKLAHITKTVASTTALLASHKK